jgi:hypothetical protein
MPNVSVSSSRLPAVAAGGDPCVSAAEAATAQADGMTSVSDLLDAMPDPAAVDEHWRRVCREMVTETAASEYERGLADGYVLAVADFKAFQQGAVRDAQAERRRWHVCCRRCGICQPD